jgi:hypothetical protein
VYVCVQHRQIVKAFEDMKRSMAEEIHLLKSEVRSLKAKLTDDENSIPARIKQGSPSKKQKLRVLLSL